MLSIPWRIALVGLLTLSFAAVARVEQVDTVPRLP